MVKPDWTLWKYCFLFKDEKMGRIEAAEFCESRNGTIASFTRLYDYQAFYKTIQGMLAIGAAVQCYSTVWS